MAFMHETDSAEGRWKKEQWRNFELWEKQELRDKRRRLIWVALAMLSCLLISIVPVWMEFSLRWKAQSLARVLADEIGRIKVEAVVDHASYRIVFKGDGSLNYRVEKVADCRSAHSELVREGSLGEVSQFVLLSPRDGMRAPFFVPGLTESFCFDSLLGNDPRLIVDDAPLGFAIVPVSDLTEKKLDRSAIVLISGRSANISFN